MVNFCTKKRTCFINLDVLLEKDFKNGKVFYIICCCQIIVKLELSTLNLLLSKIKFVFFYNYGDMSLETNWKSFMT